mmetsp:Transcript_88857/g.236617  ORF Transcript_88857/g.236617 Transcript_88857/m.236617 type:complete len:101 (-) Transcript_88857:601-903(-)
MLSANGRRCFVMLRKCTHGMFCNPKCVGTLPKTISVKSSLRFGSIRIIIFNLMASMQIEEGWVKMRREMELAALEMEASRREEEAYQVCDSIDSAIRTLL